MSSLVFEDGNYITGPHRPTWFRRHFPSLFYYTKVLPIVVKASQNAKLGNYPDPVWRKSSNEIIEALESIGGKFHVSGINNIAATQGPCVVIGNHMSTLETFALPSFTLPYKKTTFIVKKSLVNYPIFKHIMIACRPIIVERINPREDFKVVMKEGCKRLQDGISVIVFPQTTRTTQFDATQFNTIGIKLAKRADVPVIPMALKTDAWGNGKWLKDFGRIDPAQKVHITFGESLEIKGNGQEEQKTIISFIEKQLRQWQHS